MTNRTFRSRFPLGAARPFGVSGAAFAAAGALVQRLYGAKALPVARSR